MYIHLIHAYSKGGESEDEDIRCTVTGVAGQLREMLHGLLHKDHFSNKASINLYKSRIRSTVFCSRLVNRVDLVTSLDTSRIELMDSKP